MMCVRGLIERRRQGKALLLCRDHIVRVGDDDGSSDGGGSDDVGDAFHLVVVMMTMTVVTASNFVMSLKIQPKVGHVIVGSKLTI